MTICYVLIQPALPPPHQNSRIGSVAAWQVTQEARQARGSCSPKPVTRASHSVSIYYLAAGACWYGCLAFKGTHYQNCTSSVSVYCSLHAGPLMLAK